jgi:aminomethyltransferase
VQLIDISDETSLLAVQGPKSLDTLKKITDLNLDALPYYHFLRGTVAGIDCLISRTGYTGELGFEIYFAADPALGETMWNAIFEAGAEYDIEPIGLAARDTLRLEVGFCLYGNDIDETTNPLEAKLGWITKLKKGDFIGREAIMRAKDAGLKRKLVGLTIEGRAIPRHGYDIVCDGLACGTVTSGTMSPMLEKGIAMGYVPTERSEPGAGVDIMIRNQAVPAVVTKVPFVAKQ